MIHLLDKLYQIIPDIQFDDVPSKKTQTFGEAKVMKTVHYIGMSYKGGPIYIQLPMLKVRMDNSSSLFVELDEASIKNVRQLESFIVEHLHTFGEKIFKKNFTFEKIQSGFVSNIKDSSLVLNVSPFCQFYTQYKKKVERPGNLIDCPVVCLVKLANLQFIENYFTYNLLLEQVKFYEQDILEKYSFIDD